MSATKNPVLEQYTRKEISDKLGVSGQTVINWFNPNHPSSMPVKYLEPLGFIVARRDIFKKPLEEILQFVGDVSPQEDAA
jgi:DNA-binding XRE family transcriptional regulator